MILSVVLDPNYIFATLKNIIGLNKVLRGSYRSQQTSIFRKEISGNIIAKGKPVWYTRIK